MDMRLLVRLAVPYESPVCKINMDAEPVIQRFPNACDLFALCYAVSRYEGCSYSRRLFHHFRRLKIPTRHVVNLSGRLVRFPIFIDVYGENIRFLFFCL